jgi:hypothetical protein
MLLTVTTLLFATLVAGDCNADNCLRALRATQVTGRLAAAQTFCASFTSASVPATAIPSYAAAACKENQNGPLSFRISSACSCIAAATTTSPTASATTTPSATAACALVSSSWAAQKAISPSGQISSRDTKTLLMTSSYTYRGSSTSS